ncbi:MAG: ABC transporter ATP-binding protein [Pseudomonadota bacterium]
MSKSPGITISGHATIGGKHLFDPLTLKLAPGKWTCLLGGSGVGKTTILRLLAGLQSAVNFTGEISCSDDLSIANRVAYMAQSDLLLPWTSVRGNVMLGAKLRGETPDTEQLNAILERVYLTDHAHKNPAQLSGGQRQRVALARTLLEDKPIILLDEPFSALDAQTRARMQDLAVELLTGRTVLMVTHDPSEAARLSHSVAVLSSSGIELVKPPRAKIPRKIDAIATLECQASLLKQLLGQAA